MNIRVLVLAAALAPLAVPSLALHVTIDDKKVPEGDLVVPAGETRSGDAAAKGAVTVAGTVTGDCAAFGGPLTVSGECRGEAASFGGPVAVSGRVGGDIASFGGPVSISGRADGDVASFGGDLTLGSSATVVGGVTVIGGRLIQAPGSAIKGEVHSFDSRFLSALGPGLAQAVRRAEHERGDRDEGPHKVLIPGFLVGLCVLPALLVLFLPAQIEAVAAAAAAEFWRVAGHGLLIAMAILPTLVMMAVSVLGIPFIPVALAVLSAALITGLAAFFLLLSRRVCRNLGRPEPATIAAVAYGGAGLAVAAVVGGILPGIGGLLRLALFLTMCGGATLGLGAVWLTRFGTRPAPPR